MKRMTLLLTIVFLATGSLTAQSDIGLKGVGAHVGFVMPDDPMDNALGFGAQAALGTIIPDLHLSAFLDYWANSYDTGFGTDAEVTFSLLSIGALAKYHFAMDGQFTPYAGGGLGLSIGTSKIDYSSEFFGDMSESESDTELGIHLVGGAITPLSDTLDGFAELRYTLGDDVDYLGIWVGVNYKLSQ